MNPDDKRFAAEVEDHPLDYADFEGSIPDGNYGAGHVIVWDTGTYVELEDFTTGFSDGKLLFELNGHKLRGRFTLIRLKGRENSGKEWLLIKERDQWVREEPLADSSVLSGMTIETIAEPAAIEDALVGRIQAIDPCPPATVSLTESPMLARASEPFHRDGWVYEIKYDGYRLMIERNGGQVTLHSRTGIDLSAPVPRNRQVCRQAALLGVHHRQRSGRARRPRRAELLPSAATRRRSR